jgi:hypothetical protein
VATSQFEQFVDVERIDESGLPSSLAVARRLLSKLMATVLTSSEWPRRVSNSSPLFASHSFPVRFLPAVARCLPSGLKATP